MLQYNTQKDSNQQQKAAYYLQWPAIASLHFCEQKLSGHSSQNNTLRKMTKARYTEGRNKQTVLIVAA